MNIGQLYALAGVPVDDADVLRPTLIALRKRLNQLNRIATVLEKMEAIPERTEQQTEADRI